ncbi:MAG: CRISPR-associated helicase Cas3' [candidate division WOR-3 bacterium]|nr:CRISPR-associated helicase Cas3' [candidate division WOR-3 bacterium]
MNCKEFYNTYFKIPAPYPYQQEVWQAFLDGKFPMFIKAPSGAGKTESVVAPFLYQFIDSKISLAPRLIYVLPTRVLINTIAKRLESYSKEINSSISVNIQHGDTRNDPFFIGDIVVTTLDQFFYGFCRASRQVGHHIDMPAGAIASSIVVFDEANMYRDELTFSIMRALMEILDHSKIPFIVMTATMPSSLKNSLFENIKLTEVLSKDTEFKQNNTIKFTLLEEPLIKNDEVEIPDRILEKIKNKKTLIVLNQVRKAQLVYKTLTKQLNLSEDEIVLLHSRFTLEDRTEHENKALALIPSRNKDKFQSESLNKKRAIVVSTQVLEAGIDFSAELLLTELAPADSLVQRAGRCARYQGEQGEMIVFGLYEKKGKKEGENNEDKWHYPYTKEAIEDTERWLKENSSFDIKSFSDACKFVDCLNYSVSDYEAKDILFDLYECVLYADTKPENIQLRSGKPVTIVVVGPFSKTQKREKEETKILNWIKSNDIRKKSFCVDVDFLLRLKEFIKIKYELRWDDQKNEYVVKEFSQDVKPFAKYLLDSSNYDKTIGLKDDRGLFI